jgi:hypothetical protein
MGIFFKDCPQCTATHAATANECGCGYSFDPERLETPEARLELAAQEERLYEAYLAARLIQARASVDESRRLVKHNPKDAGRRSMLTDAEAQLRTAEAELKVQRDKSAFAATALEKAVPAMPARKAAGAKSKSRRKAAAPAEKASPVADKMAGPVADFAKSPTAAFRQAQERLRRAALAAQQSAQVPPMSTSDTPALNTPIAPKSFREQHAEQAQRIVSARSSRECPNCLAKVPDDIAVCKCGVNLAQNAPEMPELVLSTQEKKTLHESALASWINTRRR